MFLENHYFLADANVLIDLVQVDGLSILTKLGQVEVLDIVLAECLYPDQIQNKITQSEVKPVEIQQEWLLNAQNYRQGRLSIQDALCFYYAKLFNRILMTNEKPLRRLCEQEGIVCHGTLWIIKQAFEEQLIPSHSLCTWLKILEQQGTRMPKIELENLRKTLGC